MHIYIHPFIQGGTLRGIQAVVIASGHEITESLIGASYAVRVVDQEFEQSVPAEQQIILKDSKSVDTVPSKATLVHIGTLRLIANDQPLTQWLREAKDLVSPVM